MYVRGEMPDISEKAKDLRRAVWVSPEPAPLNAQTLHDDPLLDAILRRRVASAEEAADFLDSHARPAPDPFQLPGMAEAIERIAGALRRHEPIGIFGDYDTDGVTSAAVMTLALRSASGGEQPVTVRLPARGEGYGLSARGVEDLAAAGVRLLVAVDCGSKDHMAVALAQERGLDVVIVDHHRISEEPPAGAIVASAQLEPDSPLRVLSAAGLAYLVATALAAVGFDTGGGPGNEPTALLDLAMIGLIGDVSPLVGVNRALVRDGLRQLRATARPGLLALCDSAGIEVRKASSTDVAFRISPRLNAPGRIDDPRPAFDLLMTTEPGMARHLAEAIERANQTRKTLQDRILRDIEEALGRDPERLERRVLLFSGANWEPGIVGLVANKVAERFDRPAVILAATEETAHGSARSAAGFDITSALAGCAELLTRHGGHERAAGLALPLENLAALDEALQAAVADSTLAPPGAARLEIDADIEPERMSLSTVRLLQVLGPFGEGNPVPLLRVLSAPLRDYRVMGRERQHLKLHIGHGIRAVEAVLWNGADRSRELIGARHVDLVGELETNEWNGTSRVQLRVADFQIAD